MLQRLRERLTLFLLVALPFHALFVTVMTKLIAGPGHAPLTVLALWKEAVLGVILLLALVEILRPLRRGGGMQYAVCRGTDVIDLLILALVLLSLVVTLFTHRDIQLGIFGFKYDFLPLVVFLIARRVEWSVAFQRDAGRLLLWVGAIVAGYGIAVLFLPEKFFLWLGYSPVHSLYFADTPLAMFQQISGTMLRRAQSVMSGPNQLGLWLLIPWCIGLIELLNGQRWSTLLPLVLIGVALLLSFSRSAFIAVFVSTLVALRVSLPPSVARRAFLAALVGAVVLGVALVLLFPQVFWRLGSTRGHFVQPITAFQEMLEHSWGQGLGAAGPAQGRLRDSCTMLRQGDDPSWAKNIPKLCVFVGGVQVQPTDRACSCPLFPENWYLQVGVELGILGFLLFIALMVVMLRRLGMVGGTLRSSLFLAFLGMVIAALFLHAWEDSAVAYTLWLLSGVALTSATSSRVTHRLS